MSGQKKYQIFVSSTFRDLADERQDAIRSILDLGHIPAGMELFPAADTEQLSYIKKVIDECDYYVLIMGGRYGSLDDEGVGFTEREYDYAVETGKVVLAFDHGDASLIPVGKSDTAPRLVQNLNEFREKVMSGRLVRQWTTRESLEAMVIKSIARATTDFPAVGWIRGDTAASEDLLQQLNSLRVEVQDLRKKNKAMSQSLEPKLENLASGDHQFKLRFTYGITINRRSERRSQEFTFSWDEVFLAIAKNLSVARSTGTISLYVANHIKENRDRPNTYYSLLDSDAAVIKNQLAALGLIDVFIANTVKDGSAHEFMKLTASGKKKLAESLAVVIDDAHMVDDIPF
jgi:hypothetical protein